MKEYQVRNPNLQHFTNQVVTDGQKSNTWENRHRVSLNMKSLIPTSFPHMRHLIFTATKQLTKYFINAINSVTIFISSASLLLLFLSGWALNCRHLQVFHQTSHCWRNSIVFSLLISFCVIRLLSNMFYPYLLNTSHVFYQHTICDFVQDTNIHNGFEYLLQ